MGKRSSMGWIPVAFELYSQSMIATSTPSPSMWALGTTGLGRSNPCGKPPWRRRAPAPRPSGAPPAQAPRRRRVAPLRALPQQGSSSSSSFLLRYPALLDKRYNRSDARYGTDAPGRRTDSVLACASSHATGYPPPFPASPGTTNPTVRSMYRGRSTWCSHAPASEAGEPQAFVDVLAAHVPQNEIVEPVGVVFDDPLPDLFGSLRKVTGVAEPVAQLLKRPRFSKLRELDPLGR